MKLPLEELREKYVPLTDIPRLAAVSIFTVNRLIQEKKIPYAEFKIPGEIRRVVHVNPDDVIRALKEEG